MKVADFTPEQLKALIRESVEEALEELLGDPDCGLELRDGLKEELAASQASSIPAEEVAERLELSW
jgi:methionine synthase II (cobalamin-independent)